MAVTRLGTIEPEAAFHVSVHAPRTYVPDGADRSEYWRDLDPSRYANSLVFLDPDNGFEIKSESGNKWVLHAEVRSLLNALPASSAVVAYQQRPRRLWSDVFETLTPRLGYATYASAVYEPSLAFVLLARDRAVADRVQAAADAYVRRHDKLHHVRLTRSDA